MSTTTVPTFGTGAQFGSARELYEAAQKVRDRGFREWDVYSPFPIHGMDDAMGLGRSMLSFFSLCGGIFGFTNAFILVYYTGAIDYPTFVQAKAPFAWEPTFPVFFELTILFTAFFTIGSFLALNGLPRWHHPVFNWELFCEKAGDDGFFIVVESKDPLYEEQDIEAFLKEIGGTNVTVIADE